MSRHTRQLIEVTAALTRAVTPRDVARVVATRVAGAFEAVQAEMWVRTIDGGSLEMLGASEPGADTVESASRMPADAAVPVAIAARTGEPLWLGELAREADEAGAAAGHIAAPDSVGAAEPHAVVLPLLVDRDGLGDSSSGIRRVLGVVSVTFPADRVLSEEDRVLLDAVAAQAAQALERARLYEAERTARGEAERLRAEAERANRAKSEFLATMSHELRTPLNAISGYVDLLEMGVHGQLTPPQLGAIARVRRAQEHLLGLINDVLNYTRLEGGRVEYELRDVSLAELLADLQSMVDPLVQARRLVWNVRLGNGTERVVVDADKLRQILINLLSNAVKFTEPGGCIDLEVVQRADGGGPSDFTFVRVRDTGRGIPDNRLDAIFEPFVQVRTGYTRGDEGTGLGLAISRDLARGMGGDLRARSDGHNGSAFTLSLRRADSSAPQQQAGTA